MNTARSRAVALEWGSVGHLPIVGETHPLRRRYNAFLYRALTVALFAHLGTFAAFTIARVLRSEPPAEEKAIRIVTEIPLPPPLVIRPDVEPPLEEVIEISPPRIGMPDPVPDNLIGDVSLATNDEIAELAPAMDPAGMGGGEGGIIEVMIPAGIHSGTPGPEDFVAHEEEPILISLPAPVYPDMARQACVEGTVVVRAFVGMDGKVQKAFVTESIPMLDEAAVASVLRAVFRPALQQHKPVGVWVQVRMRFTLR